MSNPVPSSVLDTFFDSATMSVHFKEKNTIMKKKGKPWERFSEEDETIIDKQWLMTIIDGIYKELEQRDDWFLEIDKSLSKVIQLGAYRIVIVYPPLSDGLEMTVVRPVKRLTLDEYNLDDEVLEMFTNRAQWILISGAPWSGKTTFAQALADLYLESDKIVKTIESPRDLQVPDKVVQYSFTYGSHSEIRDILLLSRPDYTIYDEVRNVEDFQLYKDLRLTGIWLVWVIHATRPVDSIQRFLGTIDMGIIPQVIDTVIYMDAWMIKEIYELNLVVKVPAGMNSEDLARPVVKISSFLTKKDEYEIYSFGEQIVVMPLTDIASWSDNAPSAMQRYAQAHMKSMLDDHFDFAHYLKIVWENSVVLYVPSKFKWHVIGKSGESINQLESDLWVSIKVKVFEDLPIADVHVDVDESKRWESLVLRFPSRYMNTEVTLLIGKDMIITHTVNPYGEIHFVKKKLIKNIMNNGFVVVEK